MKKVLIFSMISFLLLSCNNLNDKNSDSKELNSTMFVEEKGKSEKGIYDDIWDMYVSYEQIPYGREGNLRIHKYNIYSITTHFQPLGDKLGIEFSIWYYEINSNEGKKLINQTYWATEKMIEGGDYLLIPNDEATLDKLADEIKKSIYGAKTIIFDETSESVYIFVNLPNYKGAVKVNHNNHNN